MKETKNLDVKETKSKQHKAASAEDWVMIARKFGEECVKIQKDSDLNTDQKLQKQNELGNKMVEKIQKDPHLSDKDKQQMVSSIHNYMDEWKVLYKKFFP